jgi:hypothetical protein
MTKGDGINIQNGNSQIILKEFGGWDGAFNYFAEDAVHCEVTIGYKRLQ